MRSDPVEASEAIERTLQSMARAVNSNDFKTWGNFWHPDAREFAPNTPAVIGRSNLLYGAEAWFEKWAHDMTIRCDEVNVAGSWAFVSGSLTCRSVCRRERKARLLAGKFLAVLIHHDCRRWLMYRFCYNSSIPLADG